MTWCFSVHVFTVDLSKTVLLFMLIILPLTLSCVYVYIIQAVYLFHSVLFCLVMFVKHTEPSNIGIWCYWVVQVGWLTPLTITQHGLNPLAVFTSGTYFLHNGMQWQWICRVTVPTLKAFLKARNQSVSGNKLELVRCATWCPKKKKKEKKERFSTPSWSSGQLENDPLTFFFHPPSLFSCNSCKHNRGGICTAS